MLRLLPTRVAITLSSLVCCATLVPAVASAQLADLRQTAVSDPPGLASPGTTFPVTDTVRNAGAASAGASTTRYYLSVDPLRDAGDAAMLGLRSIPSLAPSTSHTGTIVITIPGVPPSGMYFLLACADDFQAVNESDESNNCVASTGQVQLAAPDLQETSVSNPPVTAGVGTSFQVTDTAQNQSAVGAGSSLTGYYLSADTVRSLDDRSLQGTRGVPALTPGSSSAGTVTVTIPDATSVGMYFLLACADDFNFVAETSEANNCLASATQILVAKADLHEMSVDNPPPSVATGGSFTVTDTVQNQGAAPAGSSTSAYYLSTDTVKSFNDIRLQRTRSVPMLPMGASSMGSVSVTVPISAAAGVYFLLACADEFFVVTEANEDNNCRAAAGQVQVQAPDLAGISVIDPPASAGVGTSFSVSDTVQNQGTVSAPASLTFYYLSVDAVRSSGDVRLLGSRTVPQLAPGASHTGATQVSISTFTPNGTYFLLACADDFEDLGESSEANNCVASTSPSQVGRSDLVVTAVSSPPAVAGVGNSFPVTDTVRNQGVAEAPSSVTGYFLSADTVKSFNDIFVHGNRSVPGLAPDASHAGAVSVTIPSFAEPGTYFLLGCADDFQFVSEEEEANNCTASVGQIQVTQSDLVQTSVSDPPPTIGAGTSFPVTDTVRNQGLADGPATVTGYYLSLDAAKSFDDLSLSDVRPVPSLAAGSSSTGTLLVRVSSGAAAGTYFLLACADDFQQANEEDEANNCRASSSQTQVVLPDLLSTGVTDPPAAAGVGSSFLVTDTVENQGFAAVAGSITRYYLSSDAVKDAGDNLLEGNRGVPGLAEGAESRGSAGVTIPPGVPLGSYFLIACADAGEAINEANEVNNCAASAATMRVEQGDPELASQWHLRQRSIEPAGANVIPAWASATGTGIAIAIVDDGLQHTHPDLQPNYTSALSRDFNDDDPDPAPDPGNPHGTAVAGIAAARGENGVGVSGAAPLASVAGLRLISAPSTDAEMAAALGHMNQDIHISSNSWGPADDGATLAGPGPLAEAAIETGAAEGRGGRGTIFVWAAGNGAHSADNCNFDGFANSRFAIAVAALADSAQAAGYSEPCAANLVTAPSSGGSRGITTTDLQGANGYSFGDTTSTFGGTSAAAPLVSGIVALMLEANPSLTWRDVQHILVRASHRINPADPGWTAGRFRHHERFGFGLIDAEAAVDLARNWRNVLPEQIISPVARALGVPIPDDTSAGPSDAIAIDASFANFRVEHVEVELTAQHSYRGDLEVTLISPAGVASRLATVRPADSSDDFTGWRFRSVRHWGESAAGTWTLRVSDRAASDLGTWNGWTLRIFGTQPSAPASRKTPGDFDGDGRSDLAVYGPSSGRWVVQGQLEAFWGLPSDIPVPGDYDGDGFMDIAVFRPSNGFWFIVGRSAVPWGAPGDIPVPADYDGDGRTDIAVFRPASGTWYVRNLFSMAWGGSGDVPVPGDYDGDGMAEAAIYRPAEGQWYLSGAAQGIPFGTASDIPVPADYDGDGRLDVAVFRPSTGTWFVRNQFSARWGTGGDIPIAIDANGDGRAELTVFRRSQSRWFTLDPFSGANSSTVLGAAGDVPVLAALASLSTRAGDAEGDRRADPTVFRPSTGVWYSLLSSSGFASALLQPWGEAGDVPVPGDYLGTGRIQPAGYRPADGTWRVAGGPVVSGGAGGDVPVPADYDGDARADVALWTPASGIWTVRSSSTGWVTTVATAWGTSSDLPVPGDYDGDRRSDLAVFRPSQGRWYIRLSSSSTSAFTSVQWGVPSDIPVPADYDGDGRTDIAVWRPAGGWWFVLLSSRNYNPAEPLAVAFGTASDAPVPADYDGDGRADFAVYTESSGTWRVRNQYVVQWGTAGDIPVSRR